MKMGRGRFKDVLDEEPDEKHKDFIQDVDISSDEDEEIDEDMAFDEEDEEKYGDSFVRNFLMHRGAAKKRIVRKKTKWMKYLVM